MKGGGIRQQMARECSFGKGSSAQPDEPLAEPMSAKGGGIRQQMARECCMGKGCSAQPHENSAEPVSGHMPGPRMGVRKRTADADAASSSSAQQGHPVMDLEERPFNDALPIIYTCLVALLPTYLPT